MPNRTQYIRNEDVESWDAIPNKSAWIHEHLNQHQPDAYLISPKVAKEHPEVVRSIEKAFGPTSDSPFNRDSLNYCKNGHPIPEGKTKCMAKGCIYS